MWNTRGNNQIDYKDQQPQFIYLLFCLSNLTNELHTDSLLKLFFIISFCISSQKPKNTHSILLTTQLAG